MLCCSKFRVDASLKGAGLGEDRAWGWQEIIVGILIDRENSCGLQAVKVMTFVARSFTSNIILGTLVHVWMAACI